MKINEKLLPVKSHFFFFNAGIAPIVPFIPTLIRQLGFSTVVVGIVYTILPIASVLGKPIAGAIADRFQCRKLLLLIAILGTLLAYYLVLWVPPVERQGHVELHCSSSTNLKVKLMNNDSCLLDRLTAINSTTTCDLNCVADEKLLEEICRNWGQGQYCGKLRPPAGYVSRIVLGHLAKSGEAPSLPVNESTHHTLVLSAPQTLSFKALINPVHSMTDGDSLFLLVNKVQVTPPDWVGATCSHLLKADCNATCTNAQIQSLVTEEVAQIADANVASLYQFWLLLMCFIAGWVSMAVVVSVGDTICFELLADKGHKYGEQRLWGSIGWGLFSFVAGYLVDVFSAGLPDKDYSPAIYLMIVLLGLDILVSSRLKYTQTKKSPSILKDVKTILADLRVLLFLVWCITIGLFTAIIWNFLLNFLEDLASQYGGCDSKHWIKTLQGLVMAVQCFGGELPFFFLSGWILKKIGHVNAMSLVLFVFGIRMGLYSLLSDPWFALPIELLNGLTFGLFYATMATYAFVVAPPGTETTVQGLVGAVFEGVGVSIGSLIGGVMFNTYTGSTVFRILGLFGILASIVHFTIHFFLAKYYTPGRDNKDFRTAKYASPNDAIHILEDRSSSSPS